MAAINVGGAGGRHNKDELKSDRDNTMSAKPAATRDQFGLGHNEDKVAAHQRTLGAPAGKKDLAFRESGQDTQPARGAKNKVPARRGKKSGDQKHR